MKGFVEVVFATLVGTVVAASGSAAQEPSLTPPPTLLHSGQISLGTRSVPYLIRHLPVSSFPQLPPPIQQALTARGCLIPQTWQAHSPENVVHASLERPGSSDWAVLCSAQGVVSLLVFFSSPAPPTVLAAAPETERLHSHDTTGILGFDWAIDPATPEQVHQAQAAMEHRPARVDHDALADSLVDHRTVYHFFSKGAWTALAMPD